MDSSRGSTGTQELNKARDESSLWVRNLHIYETTTMEYGVRYKEWNDVHDSFGKVLTTLTEFDTG